MAIQVRVVVTGAGGKLGSEVVRHLTDAGYIVRGVDRRWPDCADEADPGHSYRWSLPEPPESMERLTGDLFDDDFRKQAMHGGDALVHLAEIPMLRHGDPPASVFADNTRMTSVVMEAAAHAGIRRLVYTSSCQVYGIFGTPLDKARPPVYLPLDENHPLEPNNAYGCGKVASEAYCQLIARQYEATVTALRPPSVLPDDWLGRWFRRGRQNLDSVDGVGSMVYGSDFARAVGRALHREDGRFDAFNVSAALSVVGPPLRAFLAERRPDFPPLPADWPDHQSLFSCARAREILGWQPLIEPRLVAQEHMQSLPADPALPAASSTD
ncbi:MAG: NAD-dependent epimerase/dehydratase family protein [Phycisphaerae bacterium]